MIEIRFAARPCDYGQDGIIAFRHYNARCFINKVIENPVEFVYPAICADSWKLFYSFTSKVFLLHYFIIQISEAKRVYISLFENFAFVYLKGHKRRRSTLVYSIIQLMLGNVS